jgi:thiol-disulfide isomerase/thioredoxin
MTRSALPSLLALALGALVVGCSRPDPAPKPEPTSAPTSAAAKALPVETIAAPAEGEVQEIVRSELVKAKAEGRTLLVYVGASWCEPCQRFHQAAKAGQLDGAFPGLRLLELDLDRDGDRLKRAGYVSKMIPLFAVPREDGTASGRQIEGSIKGPGAVDQISPRLRALLAGG